MVRSTVLLVILLAAFAIAPHSSLAAQVFPAADHHAHLQSSLTAHLLNQGATLHPGEVQRKESPQTAAELIAQLDAGGVQRSVALSDAYRLGSPFVHVPAEAESVDAENDWTIRQVQQYPKRLVGFCSVNPTRPYALAAIDHCARIGLRSGLKLHLANAQFDFSNPAQVRELRNVFAAADRLHMAILIHLRSDAAWNPRRDVQIFMTQVLPAALDVPVQIAHLGGWGGYDRSTDEALSTFAQDCASQQQVCRRLYFDIAAVLLDPADAHAVPGSDERLLWDQQKDFKDGQTRLAANLCRIGLDRVLFATDWPVTTDRKYVREVRTRLPLTQDQIDKIFTNVAPYFGAHS